MSKSPPETPYVALMLQTLAQARAQQYTESAPLQIVIWLAYRVLDIDARNAYAYSVLAYLFCLLGEKERGLLILKHFKHLHQQASFASDHPVEALLQALISQNPTAPQHFAIESSLELALPTLAESLSMLDNTSLDEFKGNIERGLPAINRLIGQIRNKE